MASWNEPRNERQAHDALSLRAEQTYAGRERRIAELAADTLPPEPPLRRPAPSRPDLEVYVNSTRYALTAEDVRVRAEQGRPYPSAGLPPGVRIIDGRPYYSADWL